MLAEPLRKMWAVLQTRTGRETQLVFAGQVFSAAIGFCINIILLRYLSVEQYGLFSLFSAALMLFAGFMHLGWIETFVRYGAKFKETQLFHAIRSHFFRKTLIVSVVIGLLLITLAPAVSRQIYHRSEFVSYFRAAVFGAFLTCFFSYFQNDCRIQRRYKEFFVAQVSVGFLRLLLYVAILLFGVLTLSNAVSVYLVVLSVVVMFYFVSQGHGLSQPKENLRSSVIDEISQYNKWIMISFFTTHIYGNLDSQIIAYYHGNTTLSQFGAASRLTLPLFFLVTSVTTTLLPKLSAARNPGEINYYLSLLKLFLIPLAILVLFAVWIAPPVLIWIAGPKYAGIGLLMRIQILTTWVILLTNPIGIVLLAWGWSRALAILNAVQMVVGLGFDFLWIPAHGATGAVGAALMAQFVGLVGVYLAVWVGLRRQRRVVPVA